MKNVDRIYLFFIQYVITIDLYGEIIKNDLRFLNKNKNYKFYSNQDEFYSKSTNIDFSIIAHGIERSRELTNKLNNYNLNKKCICSDKAVFCDCDEIFSADLKESIPIIQPYIRPINKIPIPCEIKSLCDCVPDCDCSCPCKCV